MGMEMRSVAKMVVAMAALAVIMATTTTAAQQQRFSAAEKAAFVQLHNKARAAVGVGPVAWSDVLAAQALQHARYCQTQHIPGPYGENLWWSYGAGTTGKPAQAMSYWVGERPYYDYRSNSCVGGECGHYTQVVWRRTAYVGCARVACNTNNGIGTIIACNYDPQGREKAISWRAAQAAAAGAVARGWQAAARSVAKLVVAMAALAVLMATTTAAQQQFSAQEKAAFVNLHNKARAAVGVGKVAWSDALAAKALEHASYCQKQHIPGPYGENLWWSYGAGTTGKPAQAMSYWSVPRKGAACFAVVVTAIVLMAATSAAGEDTAQDFVDLHNAVRAEVGVGPVTWDDTVAAYAESYAAQRQGDCKLVSSSSNETTATYGENLYVVDGNNTSSSSSPAAAAVGGWAAEEEWYDHDTNSCSAPADYRCGDYTQLVWSNTTAIGCAEVVCDGDAGIFVICNYYPPGNVPDQSPY
uniref:SCP domain-containing protein n=1 Tax=Oryza glumipatula TaxID=40148 RepID=A0A0E0AFG2_9ORYZ